MYIDRAGEVTNYSFSWLEHLVVAAVLKYIDQQRRSGVADSLPIHSATRPIFSSVRPEGDDESPVRWVLDDGESLGEYNSTYTPAPSPEVLAQIMQHALDNIASPNGNRGIYTRDIGRIVCARAGFGSEVTNYKKPLSTLDKPIESFLKVLESN